MRVLPGGVTPKSKLIGRRLVARLFDVGLFGTLGLLTLPIVNRAWTEVPGGDDVALLLATSVTVFAYILYEFVTTALTGRTLGKMLTRIEVRRLEPTHSRWRSSGLRVIPLFLFMVPGAGWVASLPVYGYALAEEHGRGMHDLLGSTQVVGTDPVLDADIVGAE
ncbi:MAG: RDD family protein [Nitriliruptoraceae bacterium]